MSQADVNVRPEFDAEIQAIADYVLDYVVDSELALDTAHYCLMDTLGCGILALNYPACVNMLGTLVPDIHCDNGVPIPGTDYKLDPVQAAFNIGAMNRWLDFNDTWLAAEWGHPSDNLAAILACADYVSRRNVANGKAPIVMDTVLRAMVKAHEIQGCLALENSFNQVGLDHVILVKVASTAMACKLLGANREQLLNAISLAWLDGQSLRTYRHAPNTGSRKSWAAGDASSRAVRLALIALSGEIGYPSALSAATWGFYDVSFKGKSFSMQREYGSYVMENILFKLSYPAEFHAQTAVECAAQLHPVVSERLEHIDKIIIETQESAVRIISKTGPLHNPADRDHCLQYMVAIALIYGDLTAEHYEDYIADDNRIDNLRQCMEVSEHKQFSIDYLDPHKRSIANSMQIYFKDGTYTDKITIEYPIGHRTRRVEGIPVLLEKFAYNLSSIYSKSEQDRIMNICADRNTLQSLAVHEFMDAWAIDGNAK